MSIKIAVLGAGSFVFGSSVLTQAFLDHGLEGVELALMDPDAESRERMAGAGRRMALERALQAEVTTHFDYPSALDGASFVINAACVQLHARFERDCEIIKEQIPGHLVSEFGGIAGISYSLRQIALVERIAAEMRARCPDAWLLDAANPLPRVCQAAHESGIKTAGFCMASMEAFGRLWRIFTGRSLPYPYAPAQEEWHVTWAGLNHFTWLVEFRSRATGEDLLPELRGLLKDGAFSGCPRSDELALELGYLLLPNDNHTKDFLPPRPGTPSRQSPGHGSPVERERRLALLKVLAEGRGKWGDLLRYGAWERPVDFIAALAFDRPAYFHALNLINDGQIPNLPSQVFVETPCFVTGGGLRPETVELPAPVRPHCERVALHTDTIVRTARERSLKAVHEAVEIDPTVLDKKAGIRAIEACIAAHSDLLPTYA